MQSIPQILAVAANAGFSGNDLTTAAAVALAESRGDETAYNPETAAKGGTPQGHGSYGLWQIYLKQHPQFDPSMLLDPQYNASAAFSIYSQAGNSFTPWATYTGGQYLGFVPQVLAAVGNPAQPAPSADGSSDGSVLDASLNGSGLSDPAMLITIAAIALELWLYFRG